jgi:hypothetical protein
VTVANTFRLVMHSIPVVLCVELVDDACVVDEVEVELVVVEVDVDDVDEVEVDGLVVVELDVDELVVVVEVDVVVLELVEVELDVLDVDEVVDDVDEEEVVEVEGVALKSLSSLQPGLVPSPLYAPVAC